MDLFSIKGGDKKHLKEFENLKVPSISLVIVNLYPFNKYIKNSDENKTIEMIDIGGPSLIRAAAKNYKYITTICNKKYYSKLLTNLKKNRGETDFSFRKIMATKTFEETSDYDILISKWFRNDKKIINKTMLRYGENPNQKSFVLKNTKKSIFDFQINGKQISYNNIIDIDNGIKCLNEFFEPVYY